jgi:hypothetical protein
MQTEERQARAHSDSWWRFAGYRIVAGRIEPLPGASWERYDPWQLEGTKRRPYVELGRLGAQIKEWHGRQVKCSLAAFAAADAPGTDASLSEVLSYMDDAKLALAGHYGPVAELPPKLAVQLTDFARRFGLLGIFAQESLLVNLEERPEALVSLPWLPGTQLLARYRRYERYGGDWRSLDRIRRSGLPSEVSAGIPTRDWLELTKSSDWPLDESKIASAGVLRRGLPGRSELPAALDLADLGEVRRSCFGGKLSGSAFPEPGSEAFWRAYGEDVVAFSAYAVRLYEALLGLKQKTARKRAPYLLRLNELLSPVSLQLVEQEGVPRARFASASLIGTLAAMAVLDIEGGTRFDTCERCGRLFAGRRKERRFCSPACQDAAKKRRRYKDDETYRERERHSARGRARAAVTKRERVGEEAG